MDPKQKDMRITFQAQTTTNNDLQTGNKPSHFVKYSILTTCRFGRNLKFTFKFLCLWSFPLKLKFWTKIPTSSQQLSSKLQTIVTSYGRFIGKIYDKLIQNEMSQLSSLGARLTPQKSLVLDPTGTKTDFTVTSSKMTKTQHLALLQGKKKKLHSAFLCFSQEMLKIEPNPRLCFLIRKTQHKFLARC